MSGNFMYSYTSPLIIMVPTEEPSSIQDMIEEMKQNYGAYWMRMFYWADIRNMCVEKMLKLEATRKHQEKVTRTILWRTSIPTPPVTDGRKFIHFWQTVAQQGKRKWMNGSAS